jgi:hypothetical protein
MKNAADIVANFDDEEDVLYVSLGRPVPSYGNERDGLIYRFSYDHDSPSGVTIVGFSQCWAARKTELFVKIGKFLHVSSALVGGAVTNALSH